MIVVLLPYAHTPTLIELIFLMQPFYSSVILFIILRLIEPGIVDFVLHFKYRSRYTGSKYLHYIFERFSSFCMINIASTIVLIKVHSMDDKIKLIQKDR
jgi:hypothetical protein